MTDIDSLVQLLEEGDQDFFWQGEASPASIARLESLLGSRLPQSFRDFLARYGGGGVVGEEVSGIEDDDPTLEHRGTVYGDTLRCRKSFGLPHHLIVTYFNEDDVVWCLDVNQFDGDECPVVSFEVSSKSTKPLAANFRDFLVEYLTLRTSR